MTSILPVAGTGEFTESALLARESLGVGLGAAEAEAIGGRDFGPDFASVLAQAVGALASTSTKAGELMSPSLRAAVDPGALGLRAPMERAALEEEAGRWLAAPLVHRAIDAYRELMNVSA